LPGGPRGPQYLAPQLAIGPEGDFYLVWLAVEPTKSWDVLFTRSIDLGATWSHPALSLKPRKETIAGGVRIAADSSGHVYLVWRGRDHVQKTREIVFIRSEDRGAHWDKPGRTLSASHTVFFPQLVTGPGGDVNVAWPEGPEAHRWLNIARSSDFGATLQDEPIRLTAAYPTSDYGILKYRLSSDGEGHLYVVWEETKSRQDYRIYLNRSSDGGKTWSSEPVLLNVLDPKVSGARNPQIFAVPKGRVYVVWEQSENQSADPRAREATVDTHVVVYFNRSLDYGNTWLPQPIRLGGTGPEPSAALGAQLSGDQDGNVYVVWIETDGPYPKRLLFTRSTDAGLTWSGPKERLDLTSPFGTRPAEPQVRSDGAGHVWVLWQELPPRPTGWQLLMNRSDDHGQTWRKKAISLVTPPQRRQSFRSVSFQSDDRGRLYVAWDGGNDNLQEIYFNRSTDFGATWLPREVRIGQR
jgi:hypothetical protein